MNVLNSSQRMHPIINLNTLPVYSQPCISIALLTYNDRPSFVIPPNIIISTVFLGVCKGGTFALTLP